MFAKPRKAATIAIVRDRTGSPGSLELLLMKRGRSDRFLPSYYVFPGGAVDSQDLSAPLSGIPPVYPHVEDGDDRVNLITHLAAAIRETFEESGLLLARDETGNIAGTVDQSGNKRFHDYRKMVSGREISFGEMLSREKLVPAYDMLYYLTQWVTPVISPIRYDARFFIAVCPDNQDISHDGDELVETTWITPEAALAANSSGKMKMVTPTVSTVRFLSRFKTVYEMTEYFHEKEKESPMRNF